MEINFEEFTEQLGAKPMSNKLREALVEEIKLFWQSDYGKKVIGEALRRENG